MLTDHNCRLLPITEQDGSVREIDWGIAVRVRDKYKGKMNKYDPSKPLNKISKGPPAEQVHKHESDHVVFAYTKMEGAWAASAVRLLGKSRECFVKRFGLSVPETIHVTAGMNPDKETSLVAAGPDTISWNVAVRSDLLPVVKGGRHAHIFGFCRELALLSLRKTFPDRKLMPLGMEEGLSAWLAGEAVRHVQTQCGQKLWPIPFTYFREEGPGYVEKWVFGDSDAAEGQIGKAKQYAKLLIDLDGIVGGEAEGEAMKALFEEAVPVRDFVRLLKEKLDGLEKIASAPDLFLPDLVDPPFLWLMPEPDFGSLEAYRGLKVKRWRTNGALLFYDENAGKETEDLADGATLFFRTPPGKWSVSAVRFFCHKTAKANHSLTLSVMDSALAPLCRIEVPIDGIRGGKKPAWQEIGSFENVVLSGSFMVNVGVPEGAAGVVRIGIDGKSGGGHSFFLKPGSHAEPPRGKHDWMVRVILTDPSGMAKSDLNKVLRDFRKSLP